VAIPNIVLENNGENLAQYTIIIYAQILLTQRRSIIEAPMAAERTKPSLGGDHL